MKKIAVFLGDFFWSSIPYDGISLLKNLQKHSAGKVDLLMFEKDIRLNKKFQGNEKYHFDTSVFTQEKSLRTLKGWDDLYLASNDYSLVISSTHIAPKVRYPSSIKTKKKCLFASWDIGGTDMLTNAIQFSDIFFTKGEIWKDWLNNKGISADKIHVTGSPHYEQYLTKSYDVVERKMFFSKYNLNNSQKTVLICPSNPGSHREQFEQNIQELRTLIELCKSLNVNMLVKTYPHDYVFYEKESPLSGIYRRVYKDKPHYELIKEMFPEVTIVESQDHHKAIMFCDAMFNMSGSHVAWETHFSNCKSYSINYKDKPYYSSVSYLKDVILPDEIYNEHMKKITDISLEGKPRHKDNEYISSLIASERITKVINNEV